MYWNPSMVSVSLAGHQAVHAAECLHCITSNFLFTQTTWQVRQLHIKISLLHLNRSGERRCLTILRWDPPGLLIEYMEHPFVRSNLCSFRSCLPRTTHSPFMSPSKSERRNTWILLSLPKHEETLYLIWRWSQSSFDRFPNAAYLCRLWTRGYRVPRPHSAAWLPLTCRKSAGGRVHLEKRRKVTVSLRFSNILYLHLHS